MYAVMLFDLQHTVFGFGLSIYCFVLFQFKSYRKLNSILLLPNITSDDIDIWKVNICYESKNKNQKPCPKSQM